MPQLYNTGLKYNSGLLYGGGQAGGGSQSRKKHMGKAKLDLKKKNDHELKTFSKDHIDKMNGNANFTQPDPSVVDYQAGHDAFEAALDASVAANATAKEKTALKDAARTALETLLTGRCNYVNLKSKGDKVKQLSSGFSVTGMRTPPVLLGPVQNLSVTAGDNAGELDYHWDPLAGAVSFILETCPDPVTPDGWERQKSPTKSKAAVTGQVSGKRVWGRVCGVNAAGDGAWSEPVSKIVP
jgi:hypothetical protein